MKKILAYLKVQKPNLPRAGVITLIIAIPLFPKFPIFTVPKTYVAIRTEDFIILFFGLILLFYLFTQIKTFLTDNLSRSIIIYLVVGLVSLLSALLITKNITPHLAFLHWARRIEYFLPFFITIFAISKSFEVFGLLYLLLAVGVLVVIYGVGQIYFGLPVISTTNEEFSKGLLLPLTGPAARANSTFAGSYDLGAFLVIVLVVSIAFLFTQKPAWLTSIKVRIPTLLAAISFYWLLLQTGSRISFIAFLAGASLMLFLLGRRLLMVPIIILSLLGLFIFSSDLSQRFIITFQQGVKIFQQQIQNRQSAIFQVLAATSTPTAAQIKIPTATQASKPASFTPPITAETEPPAPGEPANLAERIIFRSGNIRFDVEWPRAARAFLKNPILGTGYSSIGLATDNDYLRVLGETGILGFLAFVAIFVEIGRRIFKFFQNKVENESKVIVAAISGAAFAILMIATFIDIFEASKIAILFWILIGMLVVTIRQSHISR